MREGERGGEAAVVGEGEREVDGAPGGVGGGGRDGEKDERGRGPREDLRCRKVLSCGRA